VFNISSYVFMFLFIFVLIIIIRLEGLAEIMNTLSLFCVVLLSGVFCGCHVVQITAIQVTYERANNPTYPFIDTPDHYNYAPTAMSDSETWEVWTCGGGAGPFDSIYYSNFPGKEHSNTSFPKVVLFPSMLGSFLFSFLFFFCFIIFLFFLGLVCLVLFLFFLFESNFLLFVGFFFFFFVFC